ncbi:hypothetical protein GW17_00034245 [Ensete ventricosum]|nr:hypothetical protein GW17_00034245 [Ensete ventricosum]
MCYSSYIAGHIESRFAISTCTTQYGRYIPVRQVAGTQTARYRAVPPKINRRRVDFDRRRPIEGEIDRRWSIEGEIDYRSSIEREKGKKKKRKRIKKEKRKEERIPSAHVSSSPARRRHPHAVLTHAPSPPAGSQHPCAVAARGSRALFLPRGEKD